MKFAAGSMAPKIEAALNFINATNKKVIIGSLKDTPQLLTEKKGTTISN
jgi:carbamate kinase